MGKGVVEKYSMAFIAYGVFLIAYAIIVKLAFDNPNLGSQIKNYDLSFTAADIIVCWGVMKILIGLLYKTIKSKGRIQLEPRLVKLHFILTSFFVLAFLVTPILEKYFPAESSGDGFFGQMFLYYCLFAVMCYFIGGFIFVFSMIRAILIALMTARN